MVINLDTHPLEIDAATTAYDFIRGRALKPLSTVQPREFAETVMRMPDAHGATRPFTFNYAPYELEPYLEIFNPRNVEIDMMMASRLGKSRVVLTALGFIIVEQPCRIGVMWPVEGDGKLWSKDDFMGELVEPTPEIAALIDDARGQRKSKNTLLHKQFAGGLLQILGANAPGRMRRIKARVLYADEIDAIIEITTDEGDQLKIFAKRGAEYPDCIQIYCSYPSLKHRSRIEAKLLASDLRQWFVTCLLCGGQPFIMSRTGRDPFNDGRKRSRLLYDSDRPQDARLECPCCKGHLNDSQRYAMMMGGEPNKPRFDLWRATRPFTGKAGFHASSLLWPHPVDPLKYPGGYLQVLAQKEIDVETSENPERARRVLVNTDDAETFESIFDTKPDHSKLFLRREDYDPNEILPAGVLAIFFFADVQADRIELGIEGFGERRQIWELDYQVIKGSPLVDPDKGVWAELDRIITTTTWAHPSGAVLRLRGGLVDCGYQPDKVFAFTRTRARQGIYASAGSTKLAWPIIGKRAGKRGNPSTRVWELGTHEAKDVIYQCLELDNTAAAGYRHYPRLGWCSETFFKALTAENSEMRKGKDGKYHKWFGCEKGVRNEPLDIAVGCMAASKIPSLRPNFEKLAIELAVKAEGGGDAKQRGEAAKPEPPAPPSQAKPAKHVGPVKKFVRPVRPPGRGGWVGGWRR